MSENVNLRNSPGADGENRPMFTQEEVSAVVEGISQVLPAGNVPEMVLSGLMRLGERKLQKEKVSNDLAQLMRGVEGTLDKAAYLGLFGGPAAAIWAYQKLLQLAGKQVDDAFPEGVWQFYVGYGLREDTARHANETHGFDTVLQQHDIQTGQVERMTAWVMAAITCLHQYDEILATEWKECISTCVLRELTQNQKDAGYYAGLYRQWAEQKPYSREEDAADDETYPIYRWNRFKAFVQDSVQTLSPGLVEAWRERVVELEQEQLPRYQQQMTILTTLVSGQYEEIRQPISIQYANIGVIYHGHYYLIPACEPGTQTATSYDSVLNRIATIVSLAPGTAKGHAEPVSIASLARIKRAGMAQLQTQLSDSFLDSLKPLASTPILLNFDVRDRNLPLAEIRQTERGWGNHPLTVFDTGESMVFDQSHIFFDGAWGAAFAEIFTNEAISWATYMHRFPPERYAPLPTRRLEFLPTPNDLALIEQAPTTTVEASAETEAIKIRAIFQLRKLFKLRSDLLQLTVNDLLVVYRAIHAATYQPGEALAQELRELTADPATRQAAQTALRAITEQSKINPTVLIPVDASECNPRERVHPMSFEAPLIQLDLLLQHTQTVQALNDYEKGVRAAYVQFDKLQRKYLLILASLGQVFHQAKEVAIHGRTASVSSLKLLAHLPASMKKLLDSYSGQFDWMNDMIKGREVFSNIGKVIYTSTLSRFMTAKDDNEQKDLAWGVLTDKDDVMRVTLRDFRPHVARLTAVGRKDLADAITQDYLDSYARGLNQYTDDLHRITVASRETKLNSKAGRNLLHRTSDDIE